MRNKMRKESKRKTINKRQRMLVILGIVIVFAALLVALYPVISSVINDLYKSDIITNYDEIVTEIDKSKEERMLEEAREYNATLVPGVYDNANVGFTEEYMQAAAERYYDILNVRSDGMMGYVEVPAIGVYLPVYHGTSDTTLELGIGHVLGTSFPVGGVDTHAVLSGHSGMARDRMFTDLENVVEGDIFFVHVLHLTMAYKVCDIQVILPEEVDSLIVERGRDIVSLVTCVPFGINTHRLVVTGERIPYDDAVSETERTEDNGRTLNKWTTEYLKGVGMGLCGLLMFLLLYFIVSTMIKRSKKRKIAAAASSKQTSPTQRPMKRTAAGNSDAAGARAPMMKEAETGDHT